MKKLLITGGNGFVGRNLQQGLAGHYEIFAPSSSHLDISDFDDLWNFIQKNAIELVVHAANMNPSAESLRKNLLMYQNLQKISTQVERVLYFGSGAEYDKRFPISLVREEEVGRSVPVDDYGLYKYIINQQTKLCHNVFNFRLFGIYGPQEDYFHKFISNLCGKAVLGLPLNVRQNCLFDFMYITDLIPVVLWGLEAKLLYKDYNISTGISVALTDIAQIVRELSGEELPIYVAKEGFALEYTGSPSRLLQEFPMEFTSIDRGVSHLYQYFLSQRDRLDKVALGRTC